MRPVSSQKCGAVVKGRWPAGRKAAAGEDGLQRDLHSMSGMVPGPSAVSNPDGQTAARGAPLPLRGMEGQRQSSRLAEKNLQPRRSERIANGDMQKQPKVRRPPGWPVQFSIVRYDMPNEFCMSASKHSLHVLKLWFQSYSIQSCPSYFYQKFRLGSRYLHITKTCTTGMAFACN